MPRNIPWENSELQTLASDADSRVFIVQRKIPVVLQPFHLQDLKSAVQDLLNASVDSYDKSLDGILLSYKHLKVLNKSAPVAAETSGVVLEIQADFYVFRPDIGNVLKGVVNKISKDHVGVLLYRRFNVSCPRPSSDARSERWLGNHVVMHQEVMVKLKERSFSGRLPFFKGKLVGLGDVITESIDDDKKSKKRKKDEIVEMQNTSDIASHSATCGDVFTESLDNVKKSKKKKKDKIVEVSNTSEKSNPLESATPKNRKRKPEESHENLESKPKKSKENKNSGEDNLKGSVQLNVVSESVSSSPTKKKKKRTSIGIMEEPDFIPRLPLDVSQVPDDLPPPTADSTHFDLAKHLSSKAERKKRKGELLLGSLREDSSEGAKSSQNVSSLVNSSVKEEKLKKKKDKKHTTDSPSLIQEETEDQPQKLKYSSKKKSQLVGTINSTSEVETSSRYLPSSPKKKKHKTPESEVPLKVEKETNLSTKSETNVDNSNLLESSKKKKKKNTPDPAMTVAQAIPVQEKKSKKGKNTSASLHLTNEDSKVKVSEAQSQNTSGKIKDSQSSTEAKKNLDAKNLSPMPSPSKLAKKAKQKGVLDIPPSNDVDSDDTIPPGQRIRESPLTQKTFESPHKKSSPSKGSLWKSPGIGYFTQSTSMDQNFGLGSRMGQTPAPIIFSLLDNKVFSPPSSPLKLSPKKKVTTHSSDSDAPSPKKVIISSSVRDLKKDSDSSEDDEPKGKSQSHSNQALKRSEESSDDSDNDTAIKSKLLQSMGVMQFPLKTAKRKNDSSESESDGSVDIGGHNETMSLQHKTTKSEGVSRDHHSRNNTSNKPGSVGKIPTSPTKASGIASKSSPSKGKEVSADNSDSDSDLELIKAALRDIAEEKRNPDKTATAQKKKETKPRVSRKRTLSTNLNDRPVSGGDKLSAPQEKKPLSKQSQKKADAKLEAKSKNENSAKLQQKTKSIQKVPAPAKDVDTSQDSDSGPEDRNTSAGLKQIREQREVEDQKKSVKATARQQKSKKSDNSMNTKPKAQKDKLKEPKSEALEGKKSKPSKGGNISKANTAVEADEKKQKLKGKKKPIVDEEISDIMQRLLQAAKMNGRT